ncbi:MAG TPA: tRNA lysidine(34) synthetase TilS [Verrucomicrobiae bacterium]|nr:tRNA lysidine(34) synthetase TilS [Verrucomicrobiae bacterium]
MIELVRNLETTIQSRRLLNDGQRVLVAVSGGVDSMVLLHLLHSLSVSHRWTLSVAHFNHQLRGRSGNADERFVREAALRLKLKCFSEGANVKACAAKEKISVEMAARKLRHEFLARTAREQRIPTVALAHHADDQVELFLLRLLRGSGEEGLAGMRWKRSSPAHPRVTLIRPLLDCPKTALLAYAKEQGIWFREDASNDSLEIQRNRIRHELVPLLQSKYQPALLRVVARVGELSGANAEFVAQAARNWRDDPKSPFAELHVALQRSCLQQQLVELGIPPHFELIEALRLRPGKRISFGPREFLSCGRDGRIKKESVTRFQTRAPAVEVALSGRAGKLNFNGLEITWKLTKPTNNSLPGRRPRLEVFDADRVGPAVLLRHWQAGDRYQPIGMPGSVKLQDLFTNARIPRDERQRLAVACTGSGEVFWVEKLRISEQFKITPSTTRRLLWQWKPR